MKVRFNFPECAPFELTGNRRFVISRQNFVPACVRAFEEGVLQERAEQAIESLRSCRVCPRDCEIFSPVFSKKKPKPSLLCACVPARSIR
jgi:hypothetical protein